MNLSIPQDIVIEILSWLPAKSLMRFKCVTKFFNSLVFNSNFMDIHRCRSLTRPGGKKLFLHGSKFYCTSDQQKEDGINSASILQIESFGELSFHIHVDPRLNCVNNLFLLWQPLSVQPATILNPSTTEVKLLPSLIEGFSWCHYSLGFEPEEKKYKVLSTAKYDQEGYIKNRVFTLGIDETWRETKHNPSTIHCKPGICINGVIYRFVFHRGVLAIAEFDVKTENSKLIALGDALHGWSLMFIELKGKLAVIDYKTRSHEYIHLLVLEKTRNVEEWKSHIIQLPSTWNTLTWKDMQQGVIPDDISSCASCDDEILFISNLKSGTLCFCYDVTRHSWRKLEIKGLPKNHDIKGIFSYVERLVM
uniref:F-box protein n=1 Tax=Solanum tuberosum TaxID=4113 RepID=M1CEV1_SOLTU